MVRVRLALWGFERRTRRLAGRPSVFNGHVLALDKTGFSQAPTKCRE
jgi:hypothetical protein